VNASWSLEPGFVAAGAGLIGILVLAILIGRQLFSSAGTAKDHLKRAADIAATPPATPAGVASEPRAARLRALTAGSDPAARQIFDLLTQYYAANISQSLTIFWASLLAMLAGFAIIIVGIATAGSNTTDAIVAGIAGLLSQFIGATFLVALRSTQEQSTAYAQSLADLRTRDVRAAADAQAVALGLELLDQISGDGAAALVNQTRAALAMGLIVKTPVAATDAPAAAPLPAPAAPAAVAPTAGVTAGAAALRDAATDGRLRAQTVIFDQGRQADERTPER
jgi:hypothetical protein